MTPTKKKRKEKLVPIARASPIWGFLVFFGIHNWLLPEKKKRKLGCLGWLIGPVLNIYSYSQYMRYEGIFWDEENGAIVVKNITEVAGLGDIWTLLSEQGGMLQVATVSAADFGNVDTSGKLWTAATVEKSGSENSTPEVIVNESGHLIRARIKRYIEAWKKSEKERMFDERVADEALFQDAVAAKRSTNAAG